MTKPNVVKVKMVAKGLNWSGFTTFRLCRLSRVQRIIVLELAERIRQAAKRDTMTLVTPKLSVLENLAQFLVQELFQDARTESLGEADIVAKVSQIPDGVIQSLKNSEAVNIGKKEIDYEKLDSVFKANTGRFLPPPPSST